MKKVIRELRELTRIFLGNLKTAKDTKRTKKIRIGTFFLNNASSWWFSAQYSFVSFALFVVPPKKTFAKIRVIRG